MTRGVDDNEQPPVDPARDLDARFPITVTGISLYEPTGVKEHLCSISKIKPPLLEAGFAFGVIPFKVHR